MTIKQELETFAAECCRYLIEGQPCPVWRGADLRGADLSDAYLRGANLRGADLRGADLRLLAEHGFRRLPVIELEDGTDVEVISATLDVFVEVVKLNDSDPDCSPEDIEQGRDSYFKKAAAKSANNTEGGE